MGLRSPPIPEEQLKEAVRSFLARYAAAYPIKKMQILSGIGANIAGLDGSSWGRVVGEDSDCWRLSSGRIAKKQTEGLRWNWVKDEISVDAMAPEKSDLLFVKGLGDRTRVGC